MTVRLSRGRHVVEFQLRGRRIHRRLPPEATLEDARSLEAKWRREIFEAADFRDQPPEHEAVRRARLDPAAWLRLANILLNTGPIRPRPGVYFLLLRGDLQYIGQSKNVAMRLAGHFDKEFDHVVMHEASASALAELERFLIRMLRPPRNGTMARPTRNERSQSFDGGDLDGVPWRQ